MTQASRFATILPLTLFWVGLSIPGHAEEPNEMTLPRIKAKMTQNYGRLPNFTCLQTIEQFRVQRKKDKETEKHLGRLRLEVGYINGRDSFAFPGGGPFEGKSLAEVVPAGSIGAGTFGAPVRSVFLSSAPVFTYAGEEDCGGQRCYRYDYETAAEKSKYVMSVGGAGGRVPYHGWFLVDAESLRPLRMELVADELPQGFSIASATTALEFGSVSLNDADFILPTAAKVRMVDPKGNEVRNETLLTEYLPHPRPAGVVRKGGIAELASTAANTARETLPDGLRLTLILQTKFESGSTSVGDEVTAAVASKVKHGGSVVVPEGAVAHGHLVILQPVPGKGNYLAVGVEFDWLEAADKEFALSAHVEEVDFAGGKGSNVKEVMGMVGARRVPSYIDSAETMTHAQLTGQSPGTAVFYVKEKDLDKVKGVKIKYRTQKAADGSSR
jgi:hypothetical protein